MHNAAVIKLITDRYSAHVKSFNRLPVAESDSDSQYFLYKELSKMVADVFGREPLFKPSGNRAALIPANDLGNAYLALRKAMTEEEKLRYNQIQDELEDLSEKY